MKSKYPNPFQTWKQFKEQAKYYSNKDGFSIVFSDNVGNIYNIKPITFKERKKIYNYFKTKYSL